MSDLMTERYGGTTPARRRTLLVVSGIVGVLALSWVAWATWFQSNPDVQSSLTSFDVVDDHRVTAEVRVKTRDRSVEASCRVQAFSEDHSVVGERNFRVTGTEGTVTVTLPFRTEREATSVEMVGCTTPDQSRPR